MKSTTDIDPVIRRWNRSLKYWLFGMMQQGLGPAPPNYHYQGVGDELGLVVALIEQPTTRRENRSSTAAT